MTLRACVLHCFCAICVNNPESLLKQISWTNNLYFILNGLTWFLPGLRVNS
jgi:hypothetical protein